MAFKCVANFFIKILFKGELRKRIKNKCLGKFDEYKRCVKQERHYNKVLINLRKKVERKEKVRVGFLVIFDSVFSARSLYEEMLSNDFFDPFIVVMPDVARSEMLQTFNDSYESLSKQYSDVRKGYDPLTGNFTDFSDDMDMAYFDNPYDCMAHEFFSINYLRKKDILLFYINYGYMLTKYSRTVFALQEYSYFWRIFIETESILEDLKKYQIINGKNAVVTGYCKMDYLAGEKIEQRTRKTIILAPHHSIVPNTLIFLSEFLRYSDFFLELPNLYPDINFVFKPHPLLFKTLRKDEFWGTEKVDNYLSKLKSFDNVIYRGTGPYFDLFANSDAIIHDCGSFLAEYLFTERPACYMLKNVEQIEAMLGDTGQKCLENCYHAFNENDILHFINDIVIKGNDSLKDERIKFMNDVLKINYPNVGKTILEYLIKVLRHD
ncbi:MAG: hypothetical protein LBB21_05900 [Holosporaceae bacterium]|nr:hypothetical protein [Holosporaceae bacterium]